MGVGGRHTFDSLSESPHQMELPDQYGRRPCLFDFDVQRTALLYVRYGCETFCTEVRAKQRPGGLLGCSWRSRCPPVVSVRQPWSCEKHQGCPGMSHSSGVLSISCAGRGRSRV